MCYIILLLYPFPWMAFGEQKRERREDERRVEMKFLIDSDILIDVLKGVNKV